jgi:hypothetical protein
MPLQQTDFVAGDSVLVLDLLTGAWLGIWRGETFKLRMFANYYDGDDPGVVMLGEDGDVYKLCPPAPAEDDDGTPIITEIRAAVRNDLRQSGSSTLLVETECIGGRYRLSYAADGIGEDGILRDRSPDTTVSKRFGTTVDLENVGDTLLDPYREDYSLKIPESGTRLYTAGWRLGSRQRHSEVVRIPRKLRSVVIGCAGYGGRVGFRSLAVQTNSRPLGRGTEV